MGQMVPFLLTGLAFAYYLVRQPAGLRATPGGVATAAGKSMLLWVKIVGVLFVIVFAIFAGTRVH